MTRRAADRIADILEAITWCQRFAASLDADSAVIARMASDAIERNLQIIGEAANHLPPHITVVHPEVAWPAIRGMRNILVHEYFGVDPEIVRDVIHSHLEPLATALRSQLETPA